jgi:hypothetical protein
MRSILCATLIVLATARLASAGEYDVTGQTCVPDDATLLADSYVNTLSPDPFLRWTSNPSGTITLHCAIPDNVVSPTHLELYYLNNTNCIACGNDVIRVSYEKMSKTYGVVTTVSTLTGHGCTPINGLCAISTSFSDAYDPAQWVYFLKVELVRTNAFNTSQEFDYAVIF